VLLANLIHITRGVFSLLGEGPPLALGSIILEAVSKFDIQDTSLELQHEFCALWNQIVARGGPFDAREILKWIRNLYVALHKDTDAAPTLFSGSTSNLWILDVPSSYPSCNIHDHRPDSTSSIPIHVLRHNTAPAPALFSSSPDAPSSSVPTPPLVDESPSADVPLLNNHTSVPMSIHPAHPTIVEATSPDPATANATQGGIDTSTRTIPPLHA